MAAPSPVEKRAAESGVDEPSSKKSKANGGAFEVFANAESREKHLLWTALCHLRSWLWLWMQLL